MDEKGSSTGGQDQAGGRPGADALWVSGILSAAVAVLLFLAVCWYISDHYSYLDVVDRSALARFTNPGAFAPEGVEKLQYFAALAIVPPALLALNAIFLRALAGRELLAGSLCRLCLVVAAALALALIFTGLANNRFFLSGDLLYGVAGPFAAALLVPIVGVAMIYYARADGRIKQQVARWSGRLYVAAAGCITAAISLVFVMDRHSLEGSRINFEHLNAVLYSVAQARAGKVVLVDLNSQYGLYAQVLQPLFAVIGLDTLKFTVAMAMLVAVSFACFAAFLFYSVKNRLIALAGFATLAFYGYVFIKTLTYDPYYQYIPLRLVFPALLVALAGLYFRKKSRLLYYGTFAIASISFLWNLETGLVVLITWLLTIAYDEWLASPGPGHAAVRTAYHATVGMLGLLAAIALYAGYAYALRGAWPDFGMLTEYQVIFYSLGYYMIKMPVVHPWNAVALVYLAGLSYAVLARFSGRDDYRSRLVFLLAILGSGVFSYYQGRSHDYNLVQVWYPAILLLVIFADMLYGPVMSLLSSPVGRERDAGYPVNALALAMLLALLVSGTLSLAASAGPVAGMIAANFGPVAEKPQGGIVSNAGFVDANTLPGEEVVILSRDQAVYYAESGTSCPVVVPSVIESLEKNDTWEVVSYIGDPGSQAKIFVDTSYVPHHAIAQAIVDRYRAVGVAKGNGMVMYARDDGAGWCPAIVTPSHVNSSAPILYDDNTASYRDFYGKIIAFRPGASYATLYPGSSFTLELVVEPAENGAGGGYLIGTSSGDREVRAGFWVKRCGEAGNTYCFGYYNRSRGRVDVTFELEPGRPSYVAISCTPGRMSVYVDGSLVNSTTAPGPISDDQPSRRLMIGSWEDGSRTFDRTVREVRFIKAQIGAEEARARWLASRHQVALL